MTDRPRPTADSLLAFIGEQHRRLERGPFEVAPDRAREFGLIYGPCAQAIRYAAAYATLRPVGFGREGVTVARQALEHAVTAHWAHAMPDGLDRLEGEYKKSIRTFSRELAAYAGNDGLVQAIDAAAASLGPVTPPLPRITDRFLDLGADSLAFVYRQQSQLVHVTSSSASGYITWVEDGPHDIRVDAVDHYEQNTLYIAATGAMLGAWLIEQLISDSGNGVARLEEQADYLQLVYALEPKRAADA
ncbi:hypothetical protein [Frigoribacterium sp. SL97]|uniref:hypothetical protein n=1 Tax=Frigoribacterium sp. SL97 TaxID=2994664 RepID=UPI0022717CEB|nr:hypothetical protein [Frigoribacterium sp. SL97]WAC50301.1 hypothetical protein OVA02_10400 [Frigoribacterium sp. SL97]